MDTDVRQRVMMAGLGALSGICLYLLFELLDADALPDRAALALVVFATVFVTALLSLAGPLGLRRAAFGAAELGVMVAGLVSLAGLRFARVDELANGPFHVAAALAICIIALPFLIARDGAGWRNYPVLFDAAWGILVRTVAAMVFTGIVWGVIFLSDQLLLIVGLTVISDLLEQALAPWLITGISYGLGLAVAHELRAYVSAHLILRLLRLLVPVVLVVTVVFIVALPVQGLSAVFDTLSAGATMLAMVGAGVTLVSVTIDRVDAEATGSVWLAHATRALAVILLIPAALAVYAVWLRVGQYGWTPARLFAALTAGIGLIYALGYAGAALRGQGWMGRVRQVNIGMAGLTALVAALWLTPALNAERMSANSQTARFAAGTLTVAQITPWDYRRWGKPGADLLAAMQAKAGEPGHEGLAELLSQDGTAVQIEQVRADMLAALKAEMPLQPATATATALRDAILAAQADYDLATWLASCRRTMPNGARGCVMVVADMLPDIAGDEAILLQYLEGSYGNYQGFHFQDGTLLWRNVTSTDLGVDITGNPGDLIAGLQGGAPKVAPVAMNQITTGRFGLMFSPW